MTKEDRRLVVKHGNSPCLASSRCKSNDDVSAITIPVFADLVSLEQVTIEKDTRPRAIQRHLALNCKSVSKSESMAHPRIVPDRLDHIESMQSVHEGTADRLRMA